MHRPSEVREFQLTMQPDQDILWFDVAVNDVFRVAVCNRVGHLADEAGGRTLIEPARVTKQLKESTTRGILDDQVNACLVRKIAEEPEDIWMAEL
jgi:hypothetical protein